MNSSSRLVRKRFKCLKCKQSESQLVSTMQFNVKCTNCGGLLDEISENEYKLLRKKNNKEGEKNNEPIRPDKNIFSNYSNVYNRPPSHKKNSNNNNSSMNNSRYNNFIRSNVPRNSNNNIPRMNNREREERERKREKEREEREERERDRERQRRRFQSQNPYSNNNNQRNERYNNMENQNEHQNRFTDNIFSNFFNLGSSQNNNNNNNNRQNNPRFRERSVDPNSGNIFGNIFGNLFGLMTGLNSPIMISQPQIITFQNEGRPIVIRVLRHNINDDVFDQSFLNFGSNFNGNFRDNFSSNFRSNLGNFFSQLIEIVRRNREEAERNKHPPTTKEALDKLKRFPMSEKYCKKDNKGKFEYPQCCICLYNVAKGEETVLLPCGHMFHWECCLTWLKSKNTCPVCRFELPGERR